VYIVWMLVIGLIVGALAWLIIPGRDPSGVVTTMVLGVEGSLVAGFIGHALGWHEENGYSDGFLASVIGAILILLTFQLIGGSRRSSVKRS
jgi:uncharacterized membrane protein YeaQ/YmgE (transglycosylase-associated protein family)